MRLHVSAHLLHVGVRLGGREIGLLHVAREDRGLVREQPERARNHLFLRRQLDRERQLAGVEHRLELREHGVLGHGGLVAALHVARDFLAAFLHRFQVREDQLGVDHFDVPHRVHAAGDVVNVRVLEAPHDLHDRVHLADMRKKFVAQPLARACALDEARDVHELDRGRDDDVGLRDFLQHREPLVRHGHDADVWIDRAKGVIRRLGLAGAGDGVEQGGLADIGQADDSGFQHKGRERA